MCGMLRAHPGTGKSGWRADETRLKELLAQLREREEKDETAAQNRIQNGNQNGKTPFATAAAYGAGLVRERPFPGNNLDVALMAAYVILRLGGVTLSATEEEAVTAMRALGKEEISEDAFAGWLEKNSRKA